MAGNLGKTRSGASYGKPKEVAGPYKSQSSVPSIRKQATRREHRREPSPTRTPTQIVSNGRVTTSGFRSARVAKRAVRATRMRQGRTLLREGKAKRTREGVASEKRAKQTETAIKAAPPVPPAVKPTGPTPKIRQAEVKDARVFAAEQKTAPKPKANPVRQQKVARVKQRLAKAKQSSPHVTGPLVPEQKRFVNRVAKRTRLSPRAVGAQALAEESGPAAAGYEAAGEHNYLNIGPGQHYPTLAQGVHETAHLINTSSNYAGIRSARGKGPGAQVAAIGASPWGTDAGLIKQTLAEVGQRGKPIPKGLLKQARKLGINPQAPNVGKAPPRIVKKYKQVLATMKQIGAKRFGYVWGGGHASFSGPYDCSGAISAVIHSVDPSLKAPLVSGSMGQALKPGVGAITVFYNSVHVFAYIPALNKYWGTSESNPGGGAGFFPKSVGDSEVASGNSAGAYAVGHIPGLGRKQAFQLGATGLGAFPGMSISSSGTSATINAGAGTTVGKPGFSQSPIQLTPRQRYRRTTRKLAEVGIGDKAAPEEASPTLKGLERKYGATA